MKTDQPTFSCEEDLPSLPLPTLDNTVQVYLDSCKAVLEEGEFTSAWEAANRFKSSPQVKWIYVFFVKFYLQVHYKINKYEKSLRQLKFLSFLCLNFYWIIIYKNDKSETKQKKINY